MQPHRPDGIRRTPQALRAAAARCRRASNVRTEGGQAADRQLIALAMRLEQEADDLDRAASREAVTGEPKR
jgi:hypothetical protein